MSEELAGLFLHEEHRQEDGNGGEGAGEHGPPHLARSADGSRAGIFASGPPRVDVFEHHNRVVDEHPDREGHPRQADHVECAAGQAEDQECADDADRNGQRHDQGRTHVAEKEEQRGNRQQTPEDDVAADQADGRIDVGGFVVDQRQTEPLATQDRAIDVVGYLPELGHRVEHVGPRFPGHADGDVAGAEAADHAIGLAGAELHTGHVPHIHRLAVATGDDHALHLLGRAKLAERADDIASLAFPEVASRGVGILVGQGRPQIIDRELAGGEQLRIDDHLELVGSAADKIGIRHAVDALQPAFNVVLRHPSHRFDIDGGRGEGL